ncbi:uncharacterized protein LOC108024302 [Drosophila biarmipes]|uniref:uncharacterized protein LOC108024302 n=1 Tax=Drosophila biarmipes TaxID=125945 RepID=UPI0007E77C50|nr:uncharacterized protein LOC108024302 [Drosophila biarmipes]
MVRFFLALLGFSHVTLLLAKLPLEEYLVRLMGNGKLICSGIIVNRRQVLTAGYCRPERYTENITLELPEGSTNTVAGSTVSKDYTAEDASDLLVLLHLSKELGEKFGDPPPICQNRPPINEELQYWSWNGTILQKKSTPQSSLLDCRREIKDPDGVVIGNDTVCLRNKQVSEGCVRSFGIPFVWRNTFCGINILGHNCQVASKADIFVRLRKTN